LFVRKQPKGGPDEKLLVDRDWHRDLAITLARAADLPAALLEAYDAFDDTGSQDPFPGTVDDDVVHCRRLLKMMIGVLHDVAGPGVKARDDFGRILALTGPDNRNLGEAIRGLLVEAGTSSADAQAALDAVKAWDLALSEEAWWVVLSQANP